MLRVQQLFFVLMIMSALVGCGKKTMPVPPQTVLPAAIEDLAYYLDERGVTLSWTMPESTEGGDTLSAVEGFEIVRAVVPQDEYCPGCPLTFGPPQSVDAKNAVGRMISFSEALLRPGYRYFYKVRTRTGLLTIGSYSNVVSFLWEAPPAAPENLRVDSGDMAMLLTWQPPRKQLDGIPLDVPMLYQILRSADNGPFNKLGGPIAATTYSDREVKNGVHYRYKVRAVRRIEYTVLNGIASQPVGGAPRDMTPPAPPVGLVAELIDTGVRLSWQASAESDLAGYRIYFRRAAAAEPSLLAEVSAQQTSYTDKQFPAEAGYYYFVTAVDQAFPANESMSSQERIVQQK